MFAKPQSEHSWLQRFVGQWAVETECQTGPDTPIEKGQSQLKCRSLGGLWVAMEGECESPEGELWSTVLTVGYDPRLKRYIGTFVGSMMTHLWLYSGQIDDSGKRLTLDTEGPKFEGEGLAKYQDIIEVIDDDHWLLSSQILGEDGHWHHFSDARHRRRE